MHNPSQDASKGDRGKIESGGITEAFRESVAPARPAVSNRSSKGRPKPARFSVWQFVLGILLPVATLSIELATHQCASAFFDPVPTWWHIALVAFVPLSNFGIYLATERKNFSHARWLAHANALALGVALLYSILFAQLMPLAFVALAFYGWGLLPLTPLIALIATLGVRRSFQRRAFPEGRFPTLWPGLIAAIALLTLTQAHMAFTRHCLHLALQGDAAGKLRGITLLRSWGDHDYLLSACYGRSKLWFSKITFQGSLDPAASAQNVYFQVFGTAFDSVPRPELSGGGSPDFFGERHFDSALGGNQVANKVPGLTLETSRLDGKINVAAGTSYLEWIFVFKNSALRDPSEARAQFELPAGGGVSRLTLWIDGEEREAAFGGRSRVREAYQQVAVQQRRDPVLVTTCGPNRVLLQCFPVPAGGEMKVRIGMTIPLRLLDEHSSAVALPRMIETNFEPAAGFGHDLWLESDLPLGSSGTVVRRRLSEEDLRRNTRLTATRAPNTDEVWTEDPRDPQFVIQQTIRRHSVAVPARLAIVVDGSREMRSHLKGISEALKSLPAVPVSLYFAGENVESLGASERMSAEQLSSWLNQRQCVGGRDNLPALVQAWDYAAAGPNSAVVWIHGTQPILVSSAEGLLQRVEREQTPPTLYDLPVTSSPNRILEQLEKFPGLKTVYQVGTPAEDLRALLAKWNGSAFEFEAVRDRIRRADLPAGGERGNGGNGADRHLVRLWALDEIQRLQAAHQPGGLDRAIKLALEMQLVTPVSGAVVLETLEQYRRNNLEPVSADTVPTIPEPASWLLLFLAGGLLLAVRLRRPTVQSQKLTAVR